MTLFVEKISKNLVFYTFLFIAIFGVQACNSMATKSGKKEQKSPRISEEINYSPVRGISPRYSKDAQLIYLLLLAEISAQRGALPVSVSAYLKASQLTTDPKIAERATRVASFARDYKSALKAAERWAVLQPRNLDAHHSLVILYLRNKLLDKAVQEVDTVLKLTDKSKIQGFGHLIALLSNESDKGMVLSLMNKVVTKYNNNANANFAYARLALQFRKYTIARQQVERALELKPDFDAAKSLLARVQMIQGETDKALANMKALVEKNRDSVLHRASYARLLAIAKRYDKALVQFKMVLDKNPDNADIVYAIALLTLEQRKLKTSEKYFLKLLSMRKRTLEAYFYLGTIAEKYKKNKKAIEWYKKIRHGQNRVNAIIRIAQLYAKQGNIKAAREYLHSLHGRDSGLSVRLYVVEIDILSKAKKYAAAMGVANKALDNFPDNIDLLYARSLLAEKSDNLDRSEADLRKILQKEPDNIHALNALGYTLADKTQRFSEAYGYIKRAVELAPDEPAILDSMGWVLYRMGRMSESVRFLRQALKILQDDEIAAHLGEVLWVLGQKKEANRILSKALKLVPDSVHVKEVLKRFKK